MTATEQFIIDAIEGGWSAMSFYERFNSVSGDNTVFLDPLAWKAVGKVREWNSADMSGQEYMDKDQEWFLNMRRMIDALAEGKSIEEFLATL